MTVTRARKVAFWSDRLRRSLAHRGILGTARLALSYAWLYLTPGGWKERHFDSRFGVETSGRVGNYELGVNSSEIRHVVEYRPMPIRQFLRIVDALKINCEQWTFVDVGSGKGRALLLAGQFPFREVIGVEFSPGLAEIAKQNIRSYRGERRAHVSVVCQDATEYQFPNSPLILFLNNPFSGPLMVRFLKNLECFLNAHPAEVKIVYWNPFCRNLFDQAGFLRLTTDYGRYSIYEGGSAVEMVQRHASA